MRATPHHSCVFVSVKHLSFAGCCGLDALPVLHAPINATNLTRIDETATSGLKVFHSHCFACVRQNTHESHPCETHRQATAGSTIQRDATANTRAVSIA